MILGNGRMYNLPQSGFQKARRERANQKNHHHVVRHRAKPTTTNFSLKRFYNVYRNGGETANTKLCFAETQHFNFFRSLLSSHFFCSFFKTFEQVVGRCMIAIGRDIFLLLQRLFFLLFHFCINERTFKRRNLKL